MATLRRFFLTAGLTLFFLALLAACDGIGGPGNSNTNTGNSINTNYQAKGTSTPAMHATPTARATTSTYNYGNYGATPTATPAGNMNGNDGGNMQAFIHTTVVTLNGNQVHVLTNNQGFLLYYYKKDSMLTSTCIGGCAQAWPPLLAPNGMTTITSSVPLPRQLSIHMTANGNQIFYDGHALYTYTGDTQPGQFTGRAMGSVWYLVGFTL